MRMRKLWISVWMAVGCVACADKLELRDDDGAEPDAGGDQEAQLPDGVPRKSGKFTNAPREDGGLTTVVDAVQESEWQHFDLDSASADDSDDAWDLAFSRFRVRINGGLSGPGAVQVAALEGEAWDDVSEAPDAPWTPELPDSEGETGDTDSEPDNVFNAGEEDWYDYNVMTHELSPKDITYVVASTEERFYKLRLLSYYDSAGTGGFMKFDWEELDAPSGGWPPAAESGEPDDSDDSDDDE